MSHQMGRAHIIYFSELERWTPLRNAIEQGDEAASWSPVTIGDLVSQIEERVTVQPDAEYGMAGVKWYAKGVFHRETVFGRDMSAKYVTPLRPGALIYNRLFAWKESFAVVQPEHASLFVSGEFPQFQVDVSKALPGFLYLFCTIPTTIKQVNAASAGSAAVSRNRFKESEFLKFKLRLPPLDTQQAIVGHWQATQKRNAAALRAADEHEVSVTSELSKALGLGETTVPITRKAFAASWAQLQRWSLDYLRQSLANAGAEEQTHPVTTLGEVVADLANGWSPKCHPRPAEGDEWGVLKLGAVSFGQYNEAENKALPRELKPDTALEIKAGDILISRANITRLVGACAYVASTRPRLLLCDKIFRVVPLNQPKILPEFLAEMMKLPSVRQQIESLATGSSPTMKNITKPSLLSLRFPLPPLPIQKQLVADVTAARAKIAAERADAAKLAADTAREVEDMILGHRPVPNFT
ncbi:MAG: restriction endonuclease subunit S [Nitrospiraceae bacterium]